jgi:hypothetical protein
VRQNLALILALDGKFGEAEQVSRQDMSAQAATANVQAIRTMIAQNDTWRTLQSGAPKRRTKAEPPAARPPPPAGEPTG